MDAIETGGAMDSAKNDHDYSCATNAVGQVDEALEMGCTCGFAQHQVELTGDERIALWFFRGTGRYIGKDALLKDRWPKKGIEIDTLLSLSRKGLLEHFCAGRWYLTDAGREHLRKGAL